MVYAYAWNFFGFFLLEREQQLILIKSYFDIFPQGSVHYFRFFVMDWCFHKIEGPLLTKKRSLLDAVFLIFNRFYIGF